MLTFSPEYACGRTLPRIKGASRSPENQRGDEEDHVKPLVRLLIISEWLSGKLAVRLTSLQPTHNESKPWYEGKDKNNVTNNLLSLLLTTMSSLTYHTYPGVGERNAELFHYSQAVRVGDRIEISGQGMSGSLGEGGNAHKRVISNGRRMGPGDDGDSSRD